ncbi:hypothetical protein Patl1_05558 [Pistacia atlantica]|uniref:Uncharacterized protein n=1 Tax=Pistacia atlantica TaxID=434234 RepID=A0ACC1BS63_9ROSI|nr:hypothetical protein Patl1_05558 [Pistacia atlantica]
MANACSVLLMAPSPLPLPPYPNLKQIHPTPPHPK